MLDEPNSPAGNSGYDDVLPRAGVNKEKTMADPSTLSPREIVAELDRYIIGQKDAKRAVAVALRNRWRRQQLPEDLRAEVTPKNILMIGPTGVGKTEISRRLAKLAQAPGQLQPPPAVAQRDRDGALGVGLPDDEAVEFGDDFAGRKITHTSRTMRRARPSGVSTRRSFWNPAFS